MQPQFDIVIVGAGLAGLSAADELATAGFKTLLIDKGRSPGGRLASRSFGGATFDHGAQFFTTRSERFKATASQWVEAGLVKPWFNGYPDHPDGHPRYRGEPSMNAIAKALAGGKNLLLSTRVEAIETDDQGWQVHTDSDQTFSCRAILFTCPVPQTLTLLTNSHITLPSPLGSRLAYIEYDPCIAVLAVLDSPAKLPAPGALALNEGPIDWISDNQKKGISPIPAVTLHASATFSTDNFNRDRETVGLELIELARPIIGNANISQFQVHGWKYSKPRTTDSEPCLSVNDFCAMPPLVLAGDAFAGPKFEGAVSSGWAAASQLLKVL